MDRVYVVQVGAYSDRHIEAVFATREEADAFVHWFNRGDDPNATEDNAIYTFGNADVEEWVVGAPAEKPIGSYQAQVMPDGTVKEIRWQVGTGPDVRAWRWGSGYFVGYGPTVEHARRSAEEFRRVYLTTPEAALPRERGEP